jgi:hypothetical protein
MKRYPQLQQKTAWQMPSGFLNHYYRETLAISEKRMEGVP